MMMVIMIVMVMVMMAVVMMMVMMIVKCPRMSSFKRYIFYLVMDALKLFNTTRNHSTQSDTQY